VHSFLARDRNWTNLSAHVMFEKWMKSSNFQFRWERYNPRVQPASCPWSDFGTTILVVDIIHNMTVLRTSTIISCEQSLWHCSAHCVVANTLLHYLQSQPKWTSCDWTGSLLGFCSVNIIFVLGFRCWTVVNFLHAGSGVYLFIVC